jgi:hypothetical protein
LNFYKVKTKNSLPIEINRVLPLIWGHGTCW